MGSDMVAGQWVVVGMLATLAVTLQLALVELVYRPEVKRDGR